MERVGFVAVPPGSEPGFDHADVHLGSGRLYVAHTGADRIDVIDCATHTYLRSLPGLPGVAGVLIDNEQDLLFSSDRGCARVSIYRCSDEVLLNRVGVGAHPNGLAFDPARRHLFAFNLGEPVGTDCEVSVVDVDGGAVIATVPLPGRPRWAVFDPDSDSVYANIAQPAEILAIGGASLEIKRVIGVPGTGPHGLALEGARLHCATDSGSLVTLDRDSGSVLGEVELPGAPDVVILDAERSRLYVAIGEPGVISVIDTERLQKVEDITTEEGAHTIAWNPALRKLYAFLATSMGAAVYNPEP